MSALFANEFAQFFANARIIHNAFLWHINRGDARGVRLDFPDLFRFQFAQAEQAIGIAALPEIFQPGQFGFVRGDDNFPALFVSNAVFTTKGNHLLEAIDTEFRLLRTGLVVKAGMEHATIVSGLMSGQL